MANPISYNQVLRGSFTDANNKTEEWTFSGVAGDIITVIVDTDLDNDPFCDLKDPGGNTIVTNDDLENRGIIHYYEAGFSRRLLSVTGEYTIIARGRDNSDYTITLAKVQNPYSVSFTADVAIDNIYNGTLSPNIGQREKRLGFPAHFYKLSPTGTEKYTLEINADNNIGAYVCGMDLDSPIEYITDDEGTSPGKLKAISKMSFNDGQPRMIVIVPHRADITTTYNLKITRSIPIPIDTLEQIIDQANELTGSISPNFQKDPIYGKPARFYKIVQPNYSKWSFRVEATNKVKILILAIEENLYYDNDPSYYPAKNTDTLADLTLNDGALGGTAIIAIISTTGEALDYVFNARNLNAAAPLTGIQEIEYGIYNNLIVDQTSGRHPKTLEKCCILKHVVKDNNHPIVFMSQEKVQNTNNMEVEMYKEENGVLSFYSGPWRGDDAVKVPFQFPLGTILYLLVRNVDEPMPYALRALLAKCLNVDIPWPDPATLAPLELNKLNHIIIDMENLSHHKDIGYLHVKIGGPYRKGLLNVGILDKVTCYFLINGEVNSTYQYESYNLYSRSVDENTSEAIVRPNYYYNRTLPIDLRIVPVLFDGMEGLKVGAINQLTSGTINESGLSKNLACPGDDYIFKDELAPSDFALNATHKFILFSKIPEKVELRFSSFGFNPDIYVGPDVTTNIEIIPGECIYSSALALKKPLSSDLIKDALVSIGMPYGVYGDYSFKLVQNKQFTIGDIANGLHTIEFNTPAGNGLIKINSVAVDAIEIQKIYQASYAGGVIQAIRDITLDSIFEESTNDLPDNSMLNINSAIVDPERTNLILLNSKEISNGLAIEFSLLNVKPNESVKFCTIKIASFKLTSIENTFENLEVKVYLKSDKEFSDINSALTIPGGVECIVALRSKNNSVLPMTTLRIENNGIGRKPTPHPEMFTPPLSTIRSLYGFALTELFEVPFNGTALDLTNKALIFQNTKNNVIDLYRDFDKSKRLIRFENMQSPYLYQKDKHLLVCLAVDNLTDIGLSIKNTDGSTGATWRLDARDVDYPIYNSPTFEGNPLEATAYANTLSHLFTGFSFENQYLTDSGVLQGAPPVYNIFKRGSDGQFFKVPTFDPAPFIIPINKRLTESEVNQLNVSPACNYIIQLTDDKKTPKSFILQSFDAAGISDYIMLYKPPHQVAPQVVNLDAKLTFSFQSRANTSSPFVIRFGSYLTMDGPKIMFGSYDTCLFELTPNDHPSPYVSDLKPSIMNLGVVVTQDVNHYTYYSNPPSSIRYMRVRESRLYSTDPVLQDTGMPIYTQGISVNVRSNPVIRCADIIALDTSTISVGSAVPVHLARINDQRARARRAFKYGPELFYVLDDSINNYLRVISFNRAGYSFSQLAQFTHPVNKAYPILCAVEETDVIVIQFTDLRVIAYVKATKQFINGTATDYTLMPNGFFYKGNSRFKRTWLPTQSDVTVALKNPLFTLPNNDSMHAHLWFEGEKVHSAYQIMQANGCIYKYNYPSEPNPHILLNHSGQFYRVSANGDTVKIDKLLRESDTNVVTGPIEDPTLIEYNGAHIQTMASITAPHIAEMIRTRTTDNVSYFKDGIFFLNRKDQFLSSTVDDHVVGMIDVVNSRITSVSVWVPIMADFNKFLFTKEDGSMLAFSAPSSTLYRLNSPITFDAYAFTGAIP